MNNCVEWITRMQRRYATIGFIIDASLVLQKIVRLLSEPEWGVSSLTSGTAVRRVSSWRTSAAISRSELVIIPSLSVVETKLATVFADQGLRQTKSYPERNGSNHTPPISIPEASQNPRWVGFWWTHLDRWMGWAAVLSTSAHQSAILRWNCGCMIRQRPPACNLAVKLGRQTSPIRRPLGHHTL